MVMSGAGCGTVAKLVLMVIKMFFCYFPPENMVKKIPRTKYTRALLYLFCA